MCEQIIIHIFLNKLKYKLKRTCFEKCEISQIFNSEIENGCTAEFASMYTIHVRCASKLTRGVPEVRGFSL